MAPFRPALPRARHRRPHPPPHSRRSPRLAVRAQHGRRFRRRRSGTSGSRARPAASPDAALALRQSRARKGAGRLHTPSCPKDTPPFRWPTTSRFLGRPPQPPASSPLIVAAAQDHGHHPEGNRVGRFNLWRALLTETQGDPARWLYDTPPAPCTRLNALQQCTGGPVADTATAAVLGALAAPEVAKRSQRQGVTVVNVGNSHVAAFLVFKGRILGVYEHHTGMLDTDALLFDLKEFGFGWLPDEQVRAKGGHGCAFLAPAS
ncbi:MAG: DUF1786 family protein [Bilophila wadsworthia]